MSNDEILALAIKALKKGGGGGTSNYNELANKPKINSVTLSGDKTAGDLGLLGEDDHLTEEQMSSLLSLI